MFPIRKKTDSKEQHLDLDTKDAKRYQLQTRVGWRLVHTMFSAVYFVGFYFKIEIRIIKQICLIP